MTSFASCEKAGIIDVSSDEWKPYFTARNGSLTYLDNSTYNGYVSVDQTAKTYDAHYLVGNYYQFNAATAGTGASTDTTGGDATGSICPKGWTLPTSGTNGFGTNGSIAFLLKQYGLVTNYNDGVIYNANYNVTKEPLYFNRSGYLSALSGYWWGMYSIGDAQLLVSKTRASGISAYIGYFYGDNTLHASTNFSGNGNRFNGMSVRCLVMGEQ